MSLVPIDPKNEGSVITLLEVAASWLSEAVHRGEASEVAMVKAQIATAAEATRQLGLSKEIQLDAQEMVRRAEYALGRAIRRGQAEGTITRQGQHDFLGNQHVKVGLRDKKSKSSPTDFASAGELRANGAGILHLADADPPSFDAALTDAKAEGDISRANVVRKLTGGVKAGPTTRDQRADLIEELAAQGYSSRQMPTKVGVSEETVRQIARDFGIEIPADKSVGRTRRINSGQVVENTATALEGLAMGIESIDLAEVDLTVASQWVDSLTESMRALNRFVRQIKEKTQ